MRSVKLFLYVIAAFSLQSCQFKCTVGDSSDEPERRSSSVRTSNEISLQTNGVKVEKAYLVFEDGKRVPDDNIIDFSKPVHLMIKIEEGWKIVNGRVMLGAAERIEVSTGEVLLDEKDLFDGKFPDGMSPRDGKTIGLTATIRLKSDVVPLTTFIISFRVWDKNSDAYVQGNYKLYAK